MPQDICSRPDARTRTIRYPDTEEWTQYKFEQRTFCRSHLGKPDLKSEKGSRFSGNSKILLNILNLKRAASVVHATLWWPTKHNVRWGTSFFIFFTLLPDLVQWKVELSFSTERKEVKRNGCKKLVWNIFNANRKVIVLKTLAPS